MDEIHVQVKPGGQEWARDINTVFTRIVATATINFTCSSVWLLIEGGSYSRAATINFA